MTDEKKVGKKTFQGKVVSTKSQKTIVVLIETQQMDKTYKKIMKRRKKFMAHLPEEMSCSEGDVVTIEECRPISKRKTFILKSVDKKLEAIK